MRNIITIFIFIHSCCFAQQPNTLHFKSILVDTHNDILSSAMLDGIDISARVQVGHSDLARWKEGGLDVQFFSVWTGEKARTAHGFFYDALHEISLLDTLLQRNPDKIVLARKYKEVISGLAENKIVALIGVEGGHMIEDDLAKLRSLYRKGMRYLTLTWNNSTSWASSAMDKTESAFSFAGRDMQSSQIRTKGLSGFGKKVVRRMNKMGIIVDLSHVGEETFYDVLEVTRKPVMLSHSSVYPICPVFRNVKDDQIRAVAKNNGVICINFYSGSISKHWSELQQQLLKDKKQIVEQYPKELDSLAKQNRWKLFYDSSLNANRPSIAELVDHIDHIVKLVGDDYVGIGSDYDGVSSLPVGMEDVTTYPKITEELVRRGYSQSSIEKVLGKNVLRVMKDNFD